MRTHERKRFGGEGVSKWRVREHLILSKTIEAETREEAMDMFGHADGEYTLIKMTAEKIRGVKK